MVSFLITIWLFLTLVVVPVIAVMFIIVFVVRK